MQKLRATLPADTIQNAGLREDLLVEARKLVHALERPEHVPNRVGFQVRVVLNILSLHAYSFLIGNGNRGC